MRLLNFAIKTQIWWRLNHSLTFFILRFAPDCGLILTFESIKSIRSLIWVATGWIQVFFFSLIYLWVYNSEVLLSFVKVLFVSELHFSHCLLFEWISNGRTSIGLPCHSFFYLRVLIPCVCLFSSFLPEPLQKHVIIDFIQLLAEKSFAFLKIVGCANFNQTVNSFNFDSGVFVQQLIWDLP